MLSSTATRDKWTAFCFQRGQLIRQYIMMVGPEVWRALGTSMNEALDGKHAWDGNKSCQSRAGRIGQWGKSKGLSSHRSPSFTLLFDVDQGTLEAETKRKSIEGKYNGATATDSLPRAGKQLSAQRLGSWLMPNAELTKFLDSQDSDVFWDW